MRKRTFWIIGLVVILGSVGYALFRGGALGTAARVRPGEERQTSATAQAEKRDLNFSIEVTGDVTPVVQVEIKSEISARIIHLRVIAGQTVQKGDVLVELDDRDLKSQRDSALNDIEAARLAVERNKGNFGRGQGLFQAKLSSQETFDNLSNDLAVAENSLSKAQRALQLLDTQLTKTRILAPTDGTILTLPVVEGQVVATAASVNSGTSLMTIANLADLMVVTNVNQVDVAKLTKGQQMTVNMDALREPPMPAFIRFIAPLATAKNNIKGFEVDAKIEKPSPRLRPGMTVNLTIPIESVTDALCVPISAVFNENDGSKIVYVRTRNQTEKRPVKIGVTNYFYTQITDGLAVGEEVLLTPPTTGAPRKG